MKLLGWMHRKFRQNSNDPFFNKDFSIGQPEDVVYPAKPNCCTKSLIRGRISRDNQLFRKSSASANIIESDHELDQEDTSSVAYSEFFHGFLAIGTLGGTTDPAVTCITDDDPSTPTFSISVENIMEKETQVVTEDELKLINDELEKVLQGADHEIICNVSSGRNSHVSSSTGRNSYVSVGRSSHCSAITLQGIKPSTTESSPHAENNSANTIICPLQSYLLGSAAAAIGFPETTTTTITTGKKDTRMSLGELFQKAKQTEENSVGVLKTTEKTVEKKLAVKESSAVFLVKKILKRKILLPPHRNCIAACGGTTDSASSAESNKLHKILHLFHRKVHPESSAAATKKSKKQPSQQAEVRSSVGSLRSAYMMGSPNLDGLQELDINHGNDEDIIITPQCSKHCLRRFKSQSNPPQLSLNNSATNPTVGEHWIKTDSDYLVLEL